MTTYHLHLHQHCVAVSVNRSERNTVATICREIELFEGDAPEWIHLLPAGPSIAGNDGREWNMSDPDAVVGATKLPIVLDYEHQSEHTREDGTGIEAPAAAWITELSVQREDAVGKAPGVWGRVEWTPRGSMSVRNLEYRFISPAFVHTREDREILALTSAGLVHRPNLDITAINRADASGENRSDSMDEEQRKALCRALGLAEDASVEDITARADQASKALNGRSNVVPKEELEHAMNRAKQAEEKLATYERKAFESKVESVLDEAQRQGKVPPSSRDFYRDLCRSQEDLDRLEAEMKSRPAIVSDDDDASKESKEYEKAANKSRPSELTDDQKAFCAKNNIKPEMYLLSIQQEWDAKHGKEA